MDWLIFYNTKRLNDHPLNTNRMTKYMIEDFNFSNILWTYAPI